MDEADRRVAVTRAWEARAVVDGVLGVRAVVRVGVTEALGPGPTVGGRDEELVVVVIGAGCRATDLNGA